MKMKAIVAMTPNRIIGINGRLPWHLPEDFKWFKRTTMGHIVVMGRKTFESIGKPLPGRENIVLTHGKPIPNVRTLNSIEELNSLKDNRKIFLIGGAQIYTHFLSVCEELLVSEVKIDVHGDTFFPPFKHMFTLNKILSEFPDFTIKQYVRIN